MVLGAIQNLGNHMMMLSNNVSALLTSSKYMSALREFLCLVSKKRNPPGSVTLDEPIETLQLVNVHFTYPGTSNEVLHDINLCFERGQTVAIVGPNGAGKTTLIKLLMGLYIPDSGYVLINGKPLNDYDQDEIRQRFSAMFQNFGRYYISLRENIALSDIDSLSNDSKLLETLERVNGTHILNKSADGLDTLFGKKFGGHELSGGEWQRLALARALFRKADVLIMDEPNAAMDPQAEHEFYVNFEKIVDNKIAIIIAHRLAAVKQADTIVVINDGRVTAQGSHEELMKNNGFYASLYRQQASRYTDAP